MRDDFAIFILTHGRAENVATLNTIKRAGYTGKWYMVIDDEDDQADLYREKFGDEHVYQFCKQDAIDMTDTMDTFGKRAAIVYVRNKCWEIARDLGLRYFLQLDDDYSGLDFRYLDKTGKKLLACRVKSLDALCESMVQFLDDSEADTIAFCQGGDFIGGADGGNFKKGLVRKAMNSFFCRVDRPIRFSGTMNEDVTTYTTMGCMGRLFMSVTAVCVIQLPTQSVKGGMTEEYLEAGTYTKSFYSVMSMPSAVKISVMGDKHKRVHHNVDWEHCVPKIINERWKK